jgi:hypothetical protein
MSCHVMSCRPLTLTHPNQVHESLHFNQWQETEVGRGHESRHANRDFGIFSVKWSGDGREIIAGTSDENVRLQRLLFHPNCWTRLTLTHSFLLASHFSGVCF